MSETAGRRRERSAPTPFFREEGHTLGDEALEFTRWFFSSKYKLMAGFLGELRSEAQDPELLRERYRRTVTHGERVHLARGVVTLLLALGVVAAAATTIASAIDLPATQATVDLLQRAAAISASLTILLVAARLAIDRYLERVDVTATFVAMQLTAASRRGLR